MLNQNDAVRLRHMLEAARDATEFAEGRCRADLDRDKQLAKAVRKSIEDLGEAAKNVSAEFRSGHPEVPWKRLAGTRDVLIHRYFGVDQEVVWKIATDELPRIVSSLERILEAGEQG
jgi:uncharacterized protein with HEPN domain